MHEVTVDLHSFLIDRIVRALGLMIGKPDAAMAIKKPITIRANRVIASLDAFFLKPESQLSVALP